MTPLEALMREWLANPDKTKRRHAERRLAIGFGAGATLPPIATRPSLPDPYPPGIGIKVNACEHRECNTGCRLTVCRAGRGDRDDGHRTTFDNCVACITAQ